MSLAYDIFERLPDGQPMWVKAVESLEEARADIMSLEASRGRSSDDFFVFDVARGLEVSPRVLGCGEAG